MLDAATDRPAPDPSSERPEVTPDDGASRGPLASGVEHVVHHCCDDDCRPHLDPEGIECTVCGVSWSDGCAECGGHAWHLDTCSEVES